MADSLSDSIKEFKLLADAAQKANNSKQSSSNTSSITKFTKNFLDKMRAVAAAQQKQENPDDYVSYTYKPGDTFGQVILDLGIDTDKGLWGKGGDVEYYTQQLRDQGIPGMVPIGTEIRLKKRGAEGSDQPATDNTEETKAANTFESFLQNYRDMESAVKEFQAENLPEDYYKNAHFVRGDDGKFKIAYEPTGNYVEYTYKPGDTFGQVIRDLGLETGKGLWGSDGDVAYYTQQLRQQGIPGMIPIGTTIRLKKRN